MQETTNNFYNWTRLWDFDFNVKKCKRLHIGKNYPDNTYNIMNELNESFPICNVIKEKDRGVKFDQNLNFASHITTKIKLANTNLGIIYRTFTYLDRKYF